MSIKKTVDPAILNSIVKGLFQRDSNIKINFNIISTNRVVYILSLYQNRNTQYDIADKIEEKINDIYPHIRLVRNLDGRYLKLKIITAGSSGRIWISRSTSKSTTSPLLRPGVAYEYFFHSFIVDAFEKRNDLATSLGLTTVQKKNLFKIYLIITTTAGKRIQIGPINDTQQIGQQNKKTDERITLTTNTVVNLSLKQENFWWWSGGFTNDESIKKRYKSIIKAAISKGIVKEKNNQITFEPGVEGIRFPTTINEVKKFAFSEGSGDDQIRYVIKHAVEPKVSHVDDEITVYAIARNIYDINNDSDLSEVQADMYGIIGSKPGKQPISLSPYGGVYVMFVTKKYAFQNKYIDAPS